MKATTEISAKRRARVKKIMDEKGMKPGDVLDALNLPQNERRTLRQFLWNVRSDIRSANISPKRAEQLAPALGVKPIDLLIELTDREKKHAEGNSKPVRAAKGPAPVDPATEKEFRKNALERFLSDRQLSVREAAKVAGGGEDLAMDLAEARTGDTMLSYETLCAVAKAYSVDPSTLCSGLTAEEIAGLSPDAAAQLLPRKKRTYTRRKPVVAARRKTARKVAPGRKPGKKPRKARKAKRKTLEVSGIPGAIEVKADELAGLVGTRVSIREADGKYFLTAEQQITQHDLLRFLLSRLSI